MPYQFILASPSLNTRSASVEYFSDHAERGDVPNIVRDQARAKRFESQVDAAAAVPLFMHAKEHMQDVIRAALGRSAGQFTKQPISDAIHIVPVE